VFKNLSANEILVAKEKLRSLSVEYFNQYAPAEFRQYPELKSLANSSINFLDAFFDEELLAETIKVGVEAGEIFLKQGDLEKIDEEKIVQALQKGGMES